MSVTFDMPQAPCERVALFEDEPDFLTVRPVEPFLEINMSNANAAAILNLISPQDAEECCGHWKREDLIRVRRACIAAVYSKIRQGAVMANSTEFGEGGCRMVTFGRDESYVVERLGQFFTLTKVALDHGFTVSFG